VRARPILVVYAAPVWRGEGALELLRVCAALVACGHAVRLAQTTDVLTGEDLPDEAERILEQLAAFGVVPEPFESASVAGARAVLRLGAADRAGIPPLAVGRLIAEAGQVVLAP
jgi:hypothetical protein